MHRGMGVIALSYVLAMIATVLPLYDLLAWWRPLFIPMVLIYWVLALPHRHGIWEAFILGLFSDVLLGATLGQYALLYVVLAYTTRAWHQRMRVFPQLKMTFAVLFLLTLLVLMLHISERLLGRSVSFSFLILLPLLSSALIWPVLYSALRRLRGSFGVV